MAAAAKGFEIAGGEQNRIRLVRRRLSNTLVAFDHITHLCDRTSGNG